jgi:hypothetical protein
MWPKRAQGKAVFGPCDGSQPFCCQLPSREGITCRVCLARPLSVPASPSLYIACTYSCSLFSLVVDSLGQSAVFKDISPPSM